MIARLHFITKEHPQRSHVELCRMAAEAGVQLVQYRNKRCSEAERRKEVAACREITRLNGTTLIVNDHLELALEMQADGVHLGLTDLNTAEARALAGSDFIIGGTANTVEDVLAHAANGVDYVGVGPFRFTTTKKELSPVLGLQGFADLMTHLKTHTIDLPVIAIGGIVQEDIEPLRALGVHGVALSGLVADALDPIKHIEELLKVTADGSLEDWR
jgi:thiamine-phosphate pyrophosphorylase